jgi:nucleoside-diphosphate-sugar epimerase
MKLSIIITGSTGFVGANLIFNFIRDYNFNTEFIEIKKDRTTLDHNFHSESVFIHLAGKSHDIKNVSNPQEYYEVNTELTKKVYDAFLASEAKVFITLSSVKAVADQVDGELTEGYSPEPVSHYGKSKLLAEQYIFSKPIPEGKRIYVLRPCMIHGPGNKGNLSLLYKLASKQLPWPLAAFENKRSFCSIDNLCFIIKELIEREDIPSGIYNIADDEPVSTNQLIQWIAESQGKKPVLLPIPKSFIQTLAGLGDKLNLPLNSERLQKLTETYLVSNKKLKQVLAKPLPLTAKEGFMKTFQSFNQA